jgi:hypothetical protein
VNSGVNCPRLVEIVSLSACSSIRFIFVQILDEMAEVTPIAQKAPSKRLSLKVIDKTVRFRHEVLVYSGGILEKCGCLARINFAE